MAYLTFAIVMDLPGRVFSITGVIDTGEAIVVCIYDLFLLAYMLSLASLLLFATVLLMASLLLQASLLLL
jgi:hypothetical protein